MTTFAVELVVAFRILRWACGIVGFEVVEAGDVVGLGALYARGRETVDICSK